MCEEDFQELLESMDPPLTPQSSWPALRRQVASHKGCSLCLLHIWRVLCLTCTQVSWCMFERPAVRSQCTAMSKDARDDGIVLKASKTS